MARGEELGELRLVAWAGSMLILIQTDLQLDASAYATAERIIARADELGQPALRAAPDHNGENKSISPSSVAKQTISCPKPTRKKSLKV